MTKNESPKMRHYIVASLLALVGFVIAFTPFALFVPYSPLAACVAFAFIVICEMPAIEYMINKGLLD